MNAQQSPVMTTNRKRIIFLVVMSLLLISGSLLFNAPEQSRYIHIRFPSGTSLKAEVADNPERRLIGLAFREGLPARGGMLYIFDESAPHKMWTKGFLLPVDMIWVNESKHIVHLLEGAEPCEQNPCPWFGPPPENARYVIQTHAGFIQKEHVALGDQVSFSLQM